MALHAGRYLQGWVALAYQLLPARQQGLVGGLRGGRWIGDVQRCKVIGQGTQIGIVQGRQQALHQRVVAPPLLQVEQLVVQIACGLAGQARVVAVGARAALRAMAAGAGQAALGHGVLKGCSPRL